MQLKRDIFPSSSTGDHRRIVLAGIDLWITPRIDNVFVYPCGFDQDRLEDALARTLALWPLVCGRFLLVDGDHFVIEMSDKAIPMTIVDSMELTQWALDSTVVRDAKAGELLPFLDVIQTTKLWHGSSDEPLFRVKVTRLIESNEWILGISWAHVLGDAFACMNFLHIWSRFYQQMGPPAVLPVFERRLWSKGEVDRSLLPTMRHLVEALSTKENEQRMLGKQKTHEQVNIYFSGEQLRRLHSIVDDNTLTIHDVMIAYIILRLNTTSFDDDTMIIRHTNIIANYRGVSDSIAPTGLVANCTLRVLSEQFDDPYSLSNIAQTIRRSIVKFRNPTFLRSWLATADELMTDMALKEREVNIDHFQNGIIINSNFRYDWAGLINFGHTDRCRFYTDGTEDLFLRVFRLNPIYEGKQWKMRDRDGAEVAFQINTKAKKRFLHVWQHDIDENFVDVKKFSRTLKTHSSNNLIDQST